LDTAGRMQTSKNLMDEMGKIVRVVKPDVKIFIGDALAGNDTINQAREFFQYTNFDGAILTKVDADAKGGSAISIAHITSRPIVYIGVGQGYDDIIPFDSNKFISSLFESGIQADISVEEATSMQKTLESTPQLAGSDNIQTIREEEKDVLLLSAPSVKPLESMNQPSLRQEDEQETEIIKEDEPKPILYHVEPSQVKEEKPKEKKSRFRFFGKKRTEDDGTKKEEEKHKREEKLVEEEEEAETTNAKQDQRQTRDSESNLQEGNNNNNNNRKQEKGEEKVVYLTDEDIEDLLK
jgi:fused signal recognition particle receptor